MQSLYQSALARDPEERLDFLRRACDGSPWLLDEVTALFDEQFQTIRHAATVTTVSVDSGHTQHDALLDRVVGAYIIRQELGHGGMGVVYLAEDTRLGRRVALSRSRPA